MSTERKAKIRRSGVGSDTVILLHQFQKKNLIGKGKKIQTHPNDYSSGLIPSSDLEISTFGNMVEEELEEVFGFFIFVSHDTTGETWIHVQSLLTCDGMNADNRMLS
jgi:hypothetical protein